MTVAAVARVVKLAQPGYDVRTAGDENLIYSSQWPLLKIYKSGPFTVNDVQQQQTIVNHDLGFPPIFWFFTNTQITAWENSGVLTSDTRSEFFGATGGGAFSINSNRLLFNPLGFGATGSLQGYYYIFANDLTKQFTAPINNVGAVPSSTNRGRVFKLAKPGKNVGSSNLEDFVIHSDCRSPLIHSINPGTVVADGTATGNSFTVFHNLGYIPMFFGYSVSRGNSGEGPVGDYTLLPTATGGSTSFQSDTTKVQFKETTAGRKMTVVVLKDPFLVDYSVAVTV